MKPWLVASSTPSSRASNYRQLKKAANEATKTPSSGTWDMAGLAADTLALAMALHLPLLTEDKKTVLGGACGVSRAVIASSITTKENSDHMAQIRELQNRVKQLMMRAIMRLI
ncbi:hypothetical protein DV737_g2120, partial [Chaetothyriales sp. CBS 132003]